MIKDIKKVNILYNPVSTGFSEKKLNQIYDVVKNSSYKLDIFKSNEKGSITKLIEELDDENTLIITLGGDGTVSEAYKGYNNIDQKGLYSHVPTGTANDMAKNLDVRYKDADKITRDILNGEVTLMNSFKVNDEIACYTSVFGYLAHVPYVTPSILKRSLKKGGYILYASKYIIKKPVKYNISYETDNIKGNTDCILGAVSNSKGFAGINIYKDAILNDGKLELLLIKEPSASLIAKVVRDYLRNDVDLNKYKDYLIMDKTSNIKLTFNDTYPKFSFDNDGEKSSIKPGWANKDVTFSIAKPIKILKRKVK